MPRSYDPLADMLDTDADRRRCCAGDSIQRRAWYLARPLASPSVSRA